MAALQSAVKDAKDGMVDFMLGLKQGDVPSGSRRSSVTSLTQSVASGSQGSHSSVPNSPTNYSVQSPSVPHSHQPQTPISRRISISVLAEESDNFHTDIVSLSNK